MRKLAALCAVLFGLCGSPAIAGPAQNYGQPTYIDPVLSSGGQNYTSPALHSGITWLVENVNGLTNPPTSHGYSFLVGGGNADTQRFEVQCGDASWVDSGHQACPPATGSKVRSEFDGNNHCSVAFGSTMWVSYWLYLEPGFIYNSANQWFITGQLHSSNASSTYSPNVAVNFAPGDVMQVIYRWNLTSGGAQQESVVQISPKLSRGIWHRLVLEMTPVKSPSNGFVGVWLDGTQVVNYTGPLGYIEDTTPLYFKYGIYADGWQVGAVRYANYESTSPSGCPNTGSLAGRITAPLPLPFINPQPRYP